MAILQYFPRSLGDSELGNYWPNMMFHTVIQDGVTLGDATAAFGPARDVALGGKDCPNPDFARALSEGVLAHVEHLEGLAEADRTKGRLMSAGEKHLRAAVLCEHLGWIDALYWPYSSDDPSEPGKFFHRGRRNFITALQLAGGVHATVEQVEIPYKGVCLDALFVPARSEKGPAPVVIHFNGMHSSMQWHYTMRIPEFLADRGVASLLYDCPGTGTALHDLGLGLIHDDEQHANAVIDYLQKRGDVQAHQIGVLGGSWGGYRAARVAAFCDRVKAAVSWPILWGGIHEWIPRDDQEWLAKYRYWAQVESNEALFSLAQQCRLDGVASRIKTPFLVVHGLDEAQVPLSDAERFVAEATNSPGVELVLLKGVREGGQHCQWDNPNNALTLMADWLAEKLGGQCARS